MSAGSLGGIQRLDIGADGVERLVGRLSDCVRRVVVRGWCGGAGRFGIDRGQRVDQGIPDGTELGAVLGLSGITQVGAHGEGEQRHDRDHEW